MRKEQRYLVAKVHDNKDSLHPSKHEGIFFECVAAAIREADQRELLKAGEDANSIYH